MEIFFSILAVLSLTFCTFIVVDKTVFDRKLKRLKIGMTGKEIEEQENFRIQILDVKGSTYTARVFSKLTIFKCKLFFQDGKLMSKQKE